MNLNTGTYTVYRTYHLLINEERTEVPISEHEKKFMISSNFNGECPFEDFKKLAYENVFCKSVFLNDLKNAYSVKTFGTYKNQKVQVFELQIGIVGMISIATRDAKVGASLKMIEVNVSWFMIDLHISELDKLWEERSFSEYNLSMPEGMNEYEEIKIPPFSVAYQNINNIR